MGGRQQYSGNMEVEEGKEDGSKGGSGEGRERDVGSRWEGRKASKHA